MKLRHTAAFYFAIQGVAVVVWWVVLYTVPFSRKYFQLEASSETSLMAFQDYQHSKASWKIQRPENKNPKELNTSPEQQPLRAIYGFEIKKELRPSAMSG